MEQTRVLTLLVYVFPSSRRLTATGGDSPLGYSVMASPLKSVALTTHGPSSDSRKTRSGR